MAKTSILVELNRLHGKILSTTSAFDGCTKDKHKRLLTDVDNAIYEYSKVVITGIHSNAIQNDPLGIIYKSGIPNKLKPSVDRALAQLSKEEGVEFTTIDEVMTKAAAEGLIAYWSKRFSNGVKYVANIRGVKYICGWVTEKIAWAQVKWAEFLTWIKEKCDGFRSNAEPAVKLA